MRNLSIRPGQASKARGECPTSIKCSTRSQPLFAGSSIRSSSTCRSSSPPNWFPSPVFPRKRLHYSFFQSRHPISQARRLSPQSLSVSIAIHFSIVFSTANKGLVSHVCQVTSDFPKTGIEVKSGVKASAVLRALSLVGFACASKCRCSAASRITCYALLRL